MAPIDERVSFMTRYSNTESMATRLWQRLEELRKTLREKVEEKAELEREIPNLTALVETISQAYELERQYEQSKQLSLLPLQSTTLADEVIAVLDDGVARTVQELVDALQHRNWQFASQFPGRSVHAALIAVGRRGLAEKAEGKWRKK